MREINEILRSMPQIDEILRNEELVEFKRCVAQKRIKEVVRAQADKVRKQIISGEMPQADRKIIAEKITKMAVKQLKKQTKEKCARVINGTGIIIHTNLGRSPLSEEAALAAYGLSKTYSNLEYSTCEGTRKSRLRYVERLICDITGAEAALVVNNNAAAVYLALNTVCKNKEVIVSRGEIIEIGGSFRVSEIVEASGCLVKEVGTTNKTYVTDVEKAMGENTGLLLKMHTSNFKVVGFTSEVASLELVELGTLKGVPVMEDMGSGVLVDLTELGLKYERMVQDAISDGVDIITFSGDKMLGGPQCGIILGKTPYVDAMRQNQLMRCFRVDKMCLFALEATLTQYLQKETLTNIPIYEKMAMPIDVVKGRANELKKLLPNSKLNVEVKPHNAQFGGGSLPFEFIESYGVYITSSFISAATIDSFLRNSPTPVIGTIQNNEYILDLRTIDKEDFVYLRNVFSEMVE